MVDDNLMWFAFQSKKSQEDLKEVTHKVYFDVEIAGKPAGMFLLHLLVVC